MQVIFRTENNFCFVSDYRLQEFIQMQTEKAYKQANNNFL